MMIVLVSDHLCSSLSVWPIMLGGLHGRSGADHILDRRRNRWMACWPDYEGRRVRVGWRHYRRNYRRLPRRYAFSKARTSHRQWAPRGDNQRHDRCLYSALLGSIDETSLTDRPPWVGSPSDPPTLDLLLRV